MKNTYTHAGIIAALFLGLTFIAQSAIADMTEGTMEAINGEMMGGVDGVGTFLGFAESWKAFTEAFKPLTPGDEEFDPDSSPPGSPEIPSACAESTKCHECYEKAVRDINFYRYSFEKGRGLAQYGLNVVKTANAVGDSASGSMGVGGLAWTLDARPKIAKSADKLRATYKEKYEEWLAGLEVSLRALGKCEEENFGERDWYGRFGFIYYTFMADRYKNPD